MSGDTTIFNSLDLSGGILIGDRETTVDGGTTNYTYNQTSRIHHPTDISGLRIVPTMNNDLSDNHIDFITGAAGDDGMIGLTFQVADVASQSIRIVENGDAFEITNNVADGVIRIKTAPEVGGAAQDRIRIGDSVGRDLISSRYRPDAIVNISGGTIEGVDVRHTVSDVSGNIWLTRDTYVDISGDPLVVHDVSDGDVVFPTETLYSQVMYPPTHTSNPAILPAIFARK